MIKEYEGLQCQCIHSNYYSDNNLEATIVLVAILSNCQKF